jgi:hypothetical protein
MGRTGIEPATSGLARLAVRSAATRWARLTVRCGALWQGGALRFVQAGNAPWRLAGRCSTSARAIPRVLVVVNPTARKQTLRALDMRATVDGDEFFAYQHRDGRLKLLERLAAAYRADQLPDFMLEFVDSLRTRTKQPPS